MLLWLDEDREIAGGKYEAIRVRLIRILNYRGCLQAEELADEVFDRVARKVDEVVENYQGNPVYYFLNVANKIYLEYLKKPKAVELSDDFRTADDKDDFHPHYDCLKQCLKTLPADKREFIVGYYEEEKSAKINSHKKLAQTSGIELNQLHSRAFRLRKQLQKCVLKCAEGKRIGK
ncbi:MAG: sigma-70 family RNA polymerase sigma factor [Acidobacteria bacterium]|nr:sigma-70 family RNA polymerase sigma factor [Acidobacteriota bacterium]